MSPVNQHHAFADGAVSTRPKVSPAFWPIRYLLKRRNSFLQRYYFWLAWQSFEQNAMLSDNLLLGSNSYCINYHNKSDIKIGNNVVCRGIIRSEAFGSGKLEIDDHVYIGDDCIISCSNHIKLGVGSMIAHGVQIFDNDAHSLNAQERQRHWNDILHSGHQSNPDILSAPIIIGSMAWLGFNAIILKGVNLGEGCIVAAGSVVTHDVESYTIVAGNPAKLIRSLI